MQSKKSMTLRRKWVLDIGAVVGGFIVLAILQALMHGMGLMGFWPAAIRTALVLGPVLWFLNWTNAQYKQYKMTLNNRSGSSALSSEAHPTSE